MVELLVMVLVGVAYALGRAQDERDRLLLTLHELHRRLGLEKDEDWRPIEDRLEAERQIWRATAAVHEATRQAMHDVVEAEGRSSPRTTSTARSMNTSAQPRSVGPRMRTEGLSAEDVQARVKAARK